MMVTASRFSDLTAVQTVVRHPSMPAVLCPLGPTKGDPSGEKCLVSAAQLTSPQQQEDFIRGVNLARVGQDHSRRLLLTELQRFDPELSVRSARRTAVTLLGTWYSDEQISDLTHHSSGVTPRTTARYHEPNFNTLHVVRQLEMSRRIALALSC